MTIFKKLFLPGLFLVSLVTLICSCTSRTLSTVETKDLNVVVILVDTLRADHLPFYGYSENTAPFLKSIADKSVIFENAFAASSWTAPATASVFTSLYPSQHGVLTGHFANMRMQKDNPHVTFDRIPDEVTTIAEEMQSAGFKTYCVADNLNISEEMGFTQGFQKYATYRYESADKVNQTLREWHDEITSSGRYFLYIHYMDPHDPYNERAPWYKDSKDPKQQRINAYDSEISFVDAHIKEMFELYGWDKNTLVVLLADHGEEFWEHGGFGHGKTLYRESIQVPFVWYAPGIKPMRISQQVSTIDLMPTLSALLKFPALDIWEGKNLLPIIDNKASEDRFLFSELLRREDHPRPEIKSVISPDWHFITKKPKNKAMSHELFNVRTDLKEKNNLAKDKPAIVSNLTEKLDNLGKSTVKYTNTHIEKPLSPEGLEELKTLGYAE